MKKKIDDYILGLDIGTNSCGWAVTDKKNNLLKLRGKTAIGSHLFEEGHTAADRRGFRTTRRRLKRRKWRLRLLEEIFAEPMAKVDPGFFVRLHQSWVSPLDKSRKKYQAIVFPTAKEDQEYYQKYPTIYHLRDALMTQDRQFDLREIFLAIHHIVKYRGNFLHDTPVNSFVASKIDVASFLTNVNQAYADKYGEEQNFIELNENNAAEIEAVIRGKDKDKTTKQLDKAKKIAKLLQSSTNKYEKNVTRQIANAIIGYKTQFETILGKDIDKNDKADWEFKLSDGDADDKLENLLPEFDDNDQYIVAEIKKLFGSIALSQIVYENMTLSQSMKCKYKDHGDDYHLLKQYIATLSDHGQVRKLLLAYDLYVNNRHGRLLEAKKEFKQDKALTQDEFYKIVKENLDDSQLAQKILQKIEEEKFMPKQRVNKNGFIPNQLHQIELDQIIANQSKYYPFLAEENPVKEHRKQAPYKLDELVRFRVPYYVGPLISPDGKRKDEQQNKSQEMFKFAWMKRKDDSGAITPWNFAQKVDREISANRFIKRMTVKDTYLIGEDVLPARSLLYQKFEVLNELNNIRVNGKRLEPKFKQKVFNELFKQKNKVTKKAFKEFILQNTAMKTAEIDGLADPTKFNSSLSSYYHLKSTKVFDKQLDDPEYQADFEKIIEYSSIFEDAEIYQEKLHKEIKWLTPAQFKAIANWRLQGWGRLSRKLLVELKGKGGENIIYQLWTTQKNFMQIVNEPELKKAIVKENHQATEEKGIEKILDDSFTSPANKKAIRQVIKVVDDVVKAAGGKKPAQFAIEFTREPKWNPHLSNIRGTKLLKIYEDTAKKLVDQSLTDSLRENMTNRNLLKDEYFLYFIQGGRDAYTGKKIDIDDIPKKYQIDHILPQSFITDDSLDNRVLTEIEINQKKGKKYASHLFAAQPAFGLNQSISEMWKTWQKAGLISQRKLNNLLFDPDLVKDKQKKGFINRQLVETSQIIKLVSIILQDKFPDTEIITVKAGYNTALRKKLKLYKSREANDYHHAIDAYLTAICDNFLYQVYPNFRPFFVYGQFKKFSQDTDKQKEAVKYYGLKNFLLPLLDDSTGDEVMVNHTKHVVFHKQRDIFNRLIRAYNYKYMLVSRETTTENSNMFNMTIYPRGERDRKKTRKLIPKGKDLDPAIYGGYSGNTDAYMVIVKIEKTKETLYKVVGVPMRALASLKKAQKEGNYDQELNKVLEPLIMFNKNGKSKAGIKGFTVVKDHVHFKQVVIDGDTKFMLYSAQYRANAKQLTLSQETMKVVTDNTDDMDQKDADKDQLLLNAYDEILEKVDQYLPLFDINGFRQGLHDGRAKFAALKTSEKRYTLKNILNGLHDNLVTPNLKNIGIKTPFGLMQSSSGITLSPNAKLVFQSPTGLFEKRVKLTNL